MPLKNLPPFDLGANAIAINPITNKQRVSREGDKIVVRPNSLGRGWRFWLCSRLRRPRVFSIRLIEFFFLTSSRRLHPDSAASSRVPRARLVSRAIKAHLASACATMFRSDGWWKVASPNRSILRRCRRKYHARWSIDISRDPAGSVAMPRWFRAVSVPKLCGERIPTILGAWSVYNSGELYLHEDYKLLN